MNKIIILIIIIVINRVNRQIKEEKRKWKKNERKDVELNIWSIVILNRNNCTQHLFLIFCDNL